MQFRSSSSSTLLSNSSYLSALSRKLTRVREREHTTIYTAVYSVRHAAADKASSCRTTTAVAVCRCKVCIICTGYVHKRTCTRTQQYTESLLVYPLHAAQHCCNVVVVSLYIRRVCKYVHTYHTYVSDVLLSRFFVSVFVFCF